MSFNKQQYLEERYKNAKNPKHKAYYNNLLNGGKGKGKTLFSVKLNKFFCSIDEFSEYVGCSRQHTQAMLSGKRTNTYKIRLWS